MKIEVSNVSRKLGNEEVLKNINLELESGKIYGFIGRNGSGKTMLFRTLCGFLKPDTGYVKVDGRDLYKNNEFPKDTAALLEKPNYISDLTGFENLKLLSKIKNIINDDQIMETLKLVNLENEADKKFKKYSLGMKQKLGIAGVLMESPKIMILDEPFNGLDDESTEKIRKILLKEKEKGKLILIATHIKEDIEILGDVIYKMDKGVIKSKDEKR